ncbi:(Na+)-NQR maturation NqrM [Thalassotalea sp. G2M2-11]|uniref:(Na+)-NQR maturation NqrM n=1 Tax=Thalassotalea sp. G2M2-11 TaxID=2787627 RepID=UPI0019D16BFA|nr:(Na+)-NQR maturation NqrM [Thalassotalea sp. G2M2-11]
MTIFLITFGFFLVIVVAMAVGYIFQQKTLAGSCGGLSTIGIEKACDCENPCEKRKERERKAAQQQTIDIKNI